MQSVLIKIAGLPFKRWLGFFCWGKGGRMKVKLMFSTIFFMVFSFVSLTQANTEILCLNSLSYNDTDGQLYAYVVYGNGSWDSPTSQEWSE